jgi:hypothetical protein
MDTIGRLHICSTIHIGHSYCVCVCIHQMALMARGLSGRNGIIVAAPVSVAAGIEPGHAPTHPPTPPGVTVSAFPPKSSHALQRLHGVPVREHPLYTLTE